MISLLIETSTESGVVALFKGFETIYEAKLLFGLQNSKHLFPEITKAFTATGLKPADLDLVITGIGPGSYTGMRVSAMTAKTFSFALKIPLVGVCTLWAFVPKEDGPFLSLVDAKTGGVYLQKGFMKGDKATFFEGAALYSLDDASLLVKEIKTVVTPNLSLKSKFDQLIGETAWNFVHSDVNSSQMLLSALAKYEKGEFSLNGDLELLYLR